MLKSVQFSERVVEDVDQVSVNRGVNVVGTVMMVVCVLYDITMKYIAARHEGDMGIKRYEGLRDEVGTEEESLG